MKKRVLSCIQPTGDMHLGNYFGAVRNWIDLQENYDCIFGVVDYHAMTMPYESDLLRKNTLNLYIDLMASGIDTDKCKLFVQSLVPEHTELGWILGCNSSYGELSRMVQFKEKMKESKKSNGYVSSGLFTYPVLQAADILIYKAEKVPVGKDQEQHLELSRNIAQRFNNNFGTFFPEPRPLFTDIPKVKSLNNPAFKMSKSYGKNNYISIFEPEESLKRKVMSAVTDGNNGKTDIMSDGIENLFLLLKASGGIDAYESFMLDFRQGKLRYGDLKAEVFQSLKSMIAPLKEKRKMIRANSEDVMEIIHSSSQNARDIAKETLYQVKEMTGLINI